MGKWLPIDYSFIFVPISLIILVSVRKIQKNEFSDKNDASPSTNINIKE